LSSSLGFANLPAHPKAAIFSSADNSESVIQAQIDQLDQEIKELKEMKRGFEARAIRAENQADRLQFEDHYYLETRRFYQIADMNREKAARIQEEIDRLETQRAAILKKLSKMKAD
jgi:hypothetical protein